MGRPVVLGLKLLIVAVALTFGIAGTAWQSHAQEDFSAGEKFKAGDKAPDFTTVDLDGNKIILSSYEDKNVVLLNFWGLRCGACIDEIPHLNVLNDKYGAKGLAILGLNTDGVDAEIAKQTIQNVGINPNYTVLLDLDFTITDTYTNFIVPLTIVIDKKGIVQYIHTGYEAGDEKKYEKAVTSALGL